MGKKKIGYSWTKFGVEDNKWIYAREDIWGDIVVKMKDVYGHSTYHTIPKKSFKLIAKVL